MPGLVGLAERSSREICIDIFEIWDRSRSNWHWPLLPRPILGSSSEGQFPFENYCITLGHDILLSGPMYIENLFDHLIVHYIFCPRSIEVAANLALSAIRGLKDPSLAKRMLNIFSDIVVDSFRFERSSDDQDKVLLGWKRLCEQNKGTKTLSEMDRVIIGFLADYWSVPLPTCGRPEVDHLLALFSPGVRDRSLWTRQCQQMARILEPLDKGIIGRGQVRSLEILNGSANATSFAGLATSLEPAKYKEALSVLGLQGDLKRWYRDQSCKILRLSILMRLELIGTPLV
jgi:hypothetical protein